MFRHLYKKNLRLTVPAAKLKTMNRKPENEKVRKRESEKAGRALILSPARFPTFYLSYQSSVAQLQTPNYRLPANHTSVMPTGVHHASSPLAVKRRLRK